MLIPTQECVALILIYLLILIIFSILFTGIRLALRCRKCSPHRSQRRHLLRQRPRRGALDEGGDGRNGRVELRHLFRGRKLSALVARPRSLIWS